MQLLSSTQLWLSLFYDSITNEVPGLLYFSYYVYYVLPASLLNFWLCQWLKEVFLCVILIIKIM